MKRLTLRRSLRSQKWRTQLRSGFGEELGGANPVRGSRVNMIAAGESRGGWPYWSDQFLVWSHCRCQLKEAVLLGDFPGSVNPGQVISTHSVEHRSRSRRKFPGMIHCSCRNTALKDLRQGWRQFIPGILPLSVVSNEIPWDSFPSDSSQNTVNIITDNKYSARLFADDCMMTWRLAVISR